MAKDELVFENIHYQPVITDKAAWKKIKSGDFNIPKEWVERGERDSFDRIKLITKDIQEPGTVLDIGCNIGFFSHILQFLGNRVTGIDNDIHVEVKKFTQKSSIDTAKDLNKKYGLSVEFIENDFIDFLNSTNRKWDYVLFLSVFHHFFIGYGYSDFEKLSPAEAVQILQLIDRHTNKYLYFEMDENVGAPFGWGSEEEVRENINMFTSFDQVETLAVSRDGWAKGRTLLRFSRSGEVKRLPKVIDLSAHSRRNAVGAVKDGSLFVSREANDWSEVDHPYGVEVKRQAILKSGKILKKLQHNPHPNICKVLSFNDYWVELEYIDGRLLSSAAPYLKEQDDYLSGHVGIEKAIEIVKDLSAAINHLHKVGVAHTDPISFNVIIDKNNVPKFIDLVGATNATDEMKKLDLEVFWKRCAMEVFERAEYEFLDEASDQKFLELSWGSSKQVLGLTDALQKKEEHIARQNKDISSRDETIRKYDELHRSRIIKKAVKVVRISASVRHKSRSTKAKGIRLAKAIVPGPVKRLVKKSKKKLLTRKVKVKNKEHDDAKPLVSIITPYYNNAGTIMDTAQSVLTQSHQNFEYIIVDDGSDEKNKAALTKIKDPRVAFIFHQKNIGEGSPAAARNDGISKASGKYIVCLDADDQIDPTFVEKCAAVLESHPWLSLVTTYTKAFGLVNEEWGYPDYHPLNLFSNNSIISAAMFRREAWEATGGYKTGIGYEDWELWINMAEEGYFGIRIPEKLFYYRTATSSRYTEDIKKHSENTKVIKALHPKYSKRVKRILKERKNQEYQLDNSTAFINLDNYDHYRHIVDRPKILIAIPWMTFGGAETLILNFCSEIRDRYNLSFVTGLQSDHEWEYKFKEITPNIYHLTNLFEDPDLYIEFVSNYIVTRNIAALHIIHTSFMFDMLPELKRRHPKLKVIVTVFNDRAHFNESLGCRQYIDMYTSDNLVVAKLYEKELKTTEKTTIIPNGINSYDNFNPSLFDRTKYRQELGLINDELAVFFIGRLSSEKNPDVFLKVAESVIEDIGASKLKFFVIGDGAMRPKIEATIKSMGNDRIQYLGYQTDIPKFLSAADIFVLPSSIEGFPLSILEAMAMKVAVVASDVGAVADVIESGKDGFVVKPGSVEEISNTIQLLNNDRQLLQRIKRSARDKVNQKYSNKILGDNYKKMYRSVLK